MSSLNPRHEDELVRGRAPRDSVLAGWLARRLGRHDRGAVAVTVAILLAGGALLGFAALSVDVGLIYSERQQLQSGADASALAVANACARRKAACNELNDPGILPLARQYANDNADDVRADVTYVCGRDRFGALQPCSVAPASNLTRCVGERPTGVADYYVEVHVSTRTGDGQTVLPPVFSRSFTGDAGDGSSVGACARASWQVTRNGFIGFGISYCEYSWASEGGFASGNFFQRLQRNLITTEEQDHDRYHPPHFNHAVDCLHGPPPGWDDPPDFAWFDSDGSCLASVTNTSLAGGSSWSSACASFIRDMQGTHGDEIRLPIYDGAIGFGPSRRYHLLGYATFVITGFQGPAGSAASWMPHESGLPEPDPYPCPWFSQCISGQFTNAITFSTVGSGGTTRRVTLTG